MKCRQCGAPNAIHSWTVQPCAMKPKEMKAFLCDGCDVALNATVLNVFQVRGRRRMMETYRSRAR